MLGCVRLIQPLDAAPGEGAYFYRFAGHNEFGLPQQGFESNALSKDNAVNPRRSQIYDLSTELPLRPTNGFNIVDVIVLATASGKVRCGANDYPPARYRAERS